MGAGRRTRLCHRPQRRRHPRQRAGVAVHYRGKNRRRHGGTAGDRPALRCPADPRNEPRRPRRARRGGAAPHARRTRLPRPTPAGAGRELADPLPHRLGHHFRQGARHHRNGRVWMGGGRAVPALSAPASARHPRTCRCPGRGRSGAAAGPRRSRAHGRDPHRRAARRGGRTREDRAPSARHPGRADSRRQDGGARPDVGGHGARNQSAADGAAHFWRAPASSPSAATRPACRPIFA